MTSLRSRRLPTVLLLLVVLSSGARHALSQRGPMASRPSSSDSTVHARAVPDWAFWLQQSWAGAELLALLIAAYQLWARRGERRKAEAEAAAEARKASNYQAWTVVNSAQGKGGSGGRIDALQDLNRNGISLAGVRLDGAWLEGIDLSGARMPRSSLRQANLSGANLAGANLEGADLTDVNLTGANLVGVVLKGADVNGAMLGTADLRQADLFDLRNWENIRIASYLQVDEVRRAPAGFRDWALAHGAVDRDLERDFPQFSTLFRGVSG